MSLYYIDDVRNNLDNGFELERDDPSLNGSRRQALKKIYRVNKNRFNQLFFSNYGLEYLSNYFYANKKDLRVVSYPDKTNTCYEKAIVLGELWNPLNIIKALYLECSNDQMLYAAVIPETGCFMNKAQVSRKLKLRDDIFLKRAVKLPQNMTFGTCSPFVMESDLAKNGGKVSKIIFDTETLVMKKHENTLDDFSFGMDHRLSVQMNYYQCYKMLKQMYGSIVTDEEILTLSFKERFIRKNGKIKINYEFHTINYRTANFINNIHGYGDVSITNDHVDELDLPDILTSNNLLSGARGEL